MRILSIETSCDETAIAVLEAEGPIECPKLKILGNALISQINIHMEFGGVVPSLAKREHIKNLPFILEEVMKQVREGTEQSEGRTPQVSETNDIDTIAVTVGPGLEPALWTGITFAEELGKKWGLPVIGVNHMEGHILSVLYGADVPVDFPALALLVSGGHTELVFIKSFGDYQIIGRTLDDAVGEAFDKAARLLGLPYPGGPEISKLASIHRGKGVEASITFPRPMLHSKDFNFSYSGLKTAILYKIKSMGELTNDHKEELARAFEDAAIDALIHKTRKALEVNDVKTLIVAGGVVANSHLRAELKKLVEEFTHISLKLPEMFLSTDNAVMIAIAAYRQILDKEKLPEALRASGNFSL
ncbi:MAG: tRNA (adenosine(37)-N6)-threonylcarbamoyltransferase complex transferase subunit TsaD [Parcubacteria group bacterium]